jgi:hypothetical protein
MVNLENMNAQMINQGLEQKTRIIELNKIARNQLKSFLNNSNVKQLANLNPSKKIQKDGEFDEV